MAIIKGIGFSTIAHQGAGLDQLDKTLDHITQIGARYAELALYNELIITSGRVNWAQVKRLSSVCCHHGLSYTVHGPLSANLMDEVHLDHHKQVITAMIDVCEAIGASVLVLHAGRIRTARDGGRKDALLVVEREALESLGDYAGAREIKLAVETMFVETSQEDTCDPIELAQTLDRLSHPYVCATLDFSHAALMCSYRKIDYLSAIKTLGPWVNHLHIHDSFGQLNTVKTRTFAERLAYGVGDLHLPLGWGGLPWERVITELEIRPESLMIIELPVRWRQEYHESFLTAERYASLFEHHACLRETKSS